MEVNANFSQRVLVDTNALACMRTSQRRCGGTRANTSRALLGTTPMSRAR